MGAASYILLLLFYKEALVSFYLQNTLVQLASQ